MLNKKTYVSRHSMLISCMIKTRLANHWRAWFYYDYLFVFLNIVCLLSFKYRVIVFLLLTYCIL